MPNQSQNEPLPHLHKIPLEPDSRWTGFEDPQASLFLLASKIKFYSVIPEDVKNRFEVVKKLVLHSYFVYDFLDVAYEHALLTFELALKLRYQELEQRPPSKKKRTLSPLLKWAKEKILLEDHDQVFKALKNLRNNVAHPSRYSLTGTAGLALISRVTQLINDLYEDVNLRQTRKEEQKQKNDILNNFLNAGGYIIENQKRITVFSGYILWYENRLSPNSYWVALCPTFPIDEDGSAKSYSPKLFQCSTVTLTDENITLEVMNGNNIELYNDLDNEERNNLIQFLERYEVPASVYKAVIFHELNELRNLIRNRLLDHLKNQI